MSNSPLVTILYEHPEWQKPLFGALKARGVPYHAIDLKSAVWGDRDELPSGLVFNQASPSAYVRDHTRAVPAALALLEVLEAAGARTINGSRAFRFELSKAYQARVMAAAGIDYPRTLAFNSVEALAERAHEIGFPAILKPNQGGSGARMFRVESLDEVREIMGSDPTLWRPDYVIAAAGVPAARRRKRWGGAHGVRGGRAAVCDARVLGRPDL